MQSSDFVYHLYYRPNTLQLHADLNVYPKFWGHQVFIIQAIVPAIVDYRRIHERNSFDLGAICLFCFEFCSLIDFLIPIVTWWVLNLSIKILGLAC